MKRILTGIQSTGVPHLGNILGAIQPAIELSNKSENEAFLFIANMHSLTTIKDATIRKEHVRNVAAAWLAFGLDTDKNTFYVQSHIPEVCELTWYLNCFTPYPMLANAHSFKDRQDNLASVNAGLFSYPVLMAADILLYDADLVPVGKDQKQHLEITRDIASSINNNYNQEVLVVPNVKISEEVMVVPGIDGRKMSKSYNNYINIFEDEKKLRKQCMKIVTDSTPVEEPKDAENTLVYKLYKLIATKEQSLEMKSLLEKGGYGYGHAKQALFECIIQKFSKERERFNEYISNPKLIDQELEKGASKARIQARKTLERVRNVMGFKI